MEVDGQEENTGEEEVENIPFVLGMIRWLVLLMSAYLLGL